jgi:general secretion pathway protein B
MSFILEALKKSEKSRKDNRVPTLQTSHQPPAHQPARRPIWPLLLGAVLLLNALLLLWIIAPWKKDAPHLPGMAATSPSSGEVGTQIDTATASLPENLSRLGSPRTKVPPVMVSGDKTSIGKSAPDNVENEARVIAPEEITSALDTAPLQASKMEAMQSQGTAATLPSSRDLRARTSKSPSKPFLASNPAAKPVVAKSAAKKPIEKPEPAPLSNPAKVDAPANSIPNIASTPLPAKEKEADKPISPRPEIEGKKDSVYEVAQLPQAVRDVVLPIDISVHYYAHHPPSRMVRINGQILREGAHMEGGTVVDEISPDGVILRYEGYRFLIRRAVPN